MTNIPSSEKTRAKQAHVWTRELHDHYIEPVWASEKLFDVETFQGAIYDPCCGVGTIITAARNKGVFGFGADIKDHGSKEIWLGHGDFLDVPSRQFDNIVFNPPYGGGRAEIFIRKALDVARIKVAAFVDLRFLASARRAGGIFRERAPTRVWVVTPRPSCPPGSYIAAGRKAQGGTTDYVWLVWDLDAEPSPTKLGWLL